ncbi:MAG: hypothetical protein AB7L09_01415 [Nitrospira sp.]
MDNHRIDLVWEGEARFRTVLGLLVAQHNRRNGMFTHYSTRDPNYGLILYWSVSGNADPLPSPMTGEELVDFAWNWLLTASYGDQPDHDGSNGRGWRIFNEAWGHVKHDWAAFCAIQPVWSMYGK